MKTLTTLLGIGLAIAILPGCASIVSKSNWPVTFHSNPTGADISITNKKGVEVYSGKTPATMKLKSGAGFFSKESYTVVFKLDGYDTRKITLDCKLNGWYIGNLVFGGLIGFLIVDPATGAMFKLDRDFIEEQLTKGTGTTFIPTTPNQPSLQILNKDQLPAEWAKHLVMIQ